ncbi:SLBB domain-containing protein [candidate division KSB1 bacterium]|nr:SLBB domain-containing protein [candidate division KSB1 bacterium]
MKRKNRALQQLSILFIISTAALLYAQDRLIRPGDTIDIVVYGHQELSRIVTVNANGAIDFPFMQNIPVDGMSLDELRRFMEAQLMRYLDGQPVMTLNFTDTKVLSVSVLGQVKNPGTIQLSAEGTLQEALAKAGGPLAGASVEAINLIRDEDGKTQKRQFNLYRLNLLGDMNHNPTLQNGDIVLVTGSSIFSSVKIIGSVRSPGVYEPPQGATLLDMLFIAGGLDRNADISKIRHVSPSAKQSKELEVNLNDYFAAPFRYELPRVLPGDIIVVPEKRQVWRSALTLIGSVSSILSMIYTVIMIERYTSN